MHYALWKKKKKPKALNMQHLNFFLKKRDATYIQTRKYSAPTVWTTGTENTAQLTEKAKQARAGTTTRDSSDLEAQLGFTDLTGWVEQASISSFCLEDFHPHSNKTEVPQASPSHRDSPLSWAALTCSPSLLSPQKKALHGNVWESPWTLFCYTL